MALGDEDPERVEAHKLGRHVLRCVRGAPKADVDAAVREERELFWYACLHLMDLQVTEALLNRAEDLRHGVITRIDDARPAAPGPDRLPAVAATTARWADTRIWRASFRNAAPEGVSAT